ncbi:esterase-like activity of phytase family protein [Sulfurovum sp.]|uniref:esterase-like activity of phytase family protein n=1 Tax=Sulfurovum sp. TaxID=1969726 RepID=UPI002867D597|nr:esterase-like activity of phytase family protein [Sulfurovum sp.]
MKFFLFFFFSFIILDARVCEVKVTPDQYKKRFMNIKILDEKQLLFTEVNGVKFTELSDLTYEEKTKTLYLVGDKGALFSFYASFSEKIESLEALDAVTLKNKKGKGLRKWKRDSEGVALDDKGSLYVSFEGEAKIASFHKNGEDYGAMIRKYKLPKSLRSTKNYRSKNKSLESVAWHPKYGILTATEWPLKKYDKKKQTIYAISGKKWHFKAEPEGRSGLAAMEVMDDGNLLVMERSYTGLSNPFVITLKKVYLKDCKKKMCKTKVLAKLNSSEGWLLDNFEGLARVGQNRYVMISDDNDNFFQQTLLVYFEVKE